MFWKPVKQKNNYPLDLDGGLKHTRYAVGISPMPYPPIIGCMTGFLPLQDISVLSNARGKVSFGPNISNSPLNLVNQITIPELSKVG